MIIGIPKEIKEQENRVGLSLPLRSSLTQTRAHRSRAKKMRASVPVIQTRNTSQPARKIIDSGDGVCSRAEMIVKVKEPLPAEFPLLRKGQILFTYLHLAASKPLTEALLNSGVTGVAYETIQVGNQLPLLEPMSEIAGRMSVVMGAYFLAKHNGGNGVLARRRAGSVARPRGCDRRRHRRRERRAHGHRLSLPTSSFSKWISNGCVFSISRWQCATRFIPTKRICTSLMPTTDLLIGAVLVPGAKAPKLITRAMLQKMRPGSVVVDIAIDQGGCAETSRPTTHLDPVYVEEGVTHYCVANMPGAYARTSTQALTNATYRYVELLANRGLEGACKKQPALTRWNQHA